MLIQTNITMRAFFVVAFESQTLLHYCELSLGVPDPKNYESLKSHTSTVSHGSTGSKLSAASSLSGIYTMSIKAAQAVNFQSPASCSRSKYL